MGSVREKIRVEPMFRFDHYLRSRTQSQLNKRMLSIYKLIEKEKDNQEYGLDHQTLKENKKKMKKRKMEEKNMEREGEEIKEKKKDKKHKQPVPSSPSREIPVERI